MPVCPRIISFTGDHAFLSNFYHAQVRWMGENYDTVEHAFQSMKTTDPEWKRRIKESATPGQAKRLGRKAPMRKNWDAIRLNVMEELVRRKFADHSELRARLLMTGDGRLVEGNAWGDKFWGKVWEDEKWRGKNHLGRILMRIRDELRPSR